MKAELRRYCRTLDRKLDCPFSLRRHFQAQPRQMAEELLGALPGCAAEELQDFLGPPEELAACFRETVGPERLRVYGRNSRFSSGCSLAVAPFCWRPWPLLRSI